MIYDEIKPGMLVRDRWVSHSYVSCNYKAIQGWGMGKVIKKLKTVVHIRFSFKGLVVFDLDHLQFLERV